MHKLISFLIILFFLGLVGCNSTPPHILPTSLPTPAVISAFTATIPNQTPTIVSTSSGADLPAIPSPTLIPVINSLLPIENRLLCDLDYPSGVLEIHQEITYTNQTAEQMSELGLYVEPNLYPGALEIKSISSPTLARVNYTLNQNALFISLSTAPLPAGKSILLSFEYSILLPEMNSTAGNGIFGRSSIQTNLMDWYFWPAPYSKSKGWLIHPPSPVGEHTAYPLQDFDLILRISNAPENLVVTGGATPEFDGTSYHFNHPSARNLVISISPYFQVTRKIQGGVVLSTFTFPDHTDSALHILDVTARAIQIFGEGISPYPRPVLNIVESNLGDGLEADGLYFLGSRFLDGNYLTERSILTLLAAHETAHQWWYAAVSNDQALEPWLDEAFCTWMERLYFSSSPEALNWWRAYRLSGDFSHFPVNQTVYSFKSFKPYRESVYLHGAQMLEYLQQAMGDDQFMHFLQQYYSTGKAKELSSSQVFFSTLANFGKIDPALIKEKYFLQE